MNDRIMKILDHQEIEDKNELTENLEALISREFSDSDNLISQIQKFDKNLSINNALIRIATEFSVRKHTTCLIPYYHSHDFCELIYVDKGACTQYVNGETTPFILKEGEICLLTPGTIHALQPSNVDDLVLKVVLPHYMVKQIVHSMTFEHSEFANSLFANNEIYTWNLHFSRQFGVNALFTQILEEFYFGELFKEAAIQGYLLLLFVALARQQTNNVDKGLLHIVYEYIHKHLGTATLSGLASQNGYSARHMSRLLYEKAGGTFSDILQRIRIEEAAALLVETDLTVEQISSKVGYKSVSGLYKRFVSIFEMPPGQYQKRHREYGKRQ